VRKRSKPPQAPEQRLEGRRRLNKKYRDANPEATRAANAERNRAYRQRHAETINARLRAKRRGEGPPRPPLTAEQMKERADRKRAQNAKSKKAYDERNREKNAERMRAYRRAKKEEAARAQAEAD
jgi:hypothetical protein